MTVLIQTDHARIAIGEPRHHTIIVLRAPSAEQLIKQALLKLVCKGRASSLLV